MKKAALLFLPILLFFSEPCPAIFEGTANADIFIRIYNKQKDYGKLALWHEAAAECLMQISIPMNKIAMNYYKKKGFNKLVERSEKEAFEIKEQHQFHIKSAQVAWKKSTTHQKSIKLEREKISKFMATWLPHYPDRFYDFGIYAIFFREQQEIAEFNRDYTEVLQLEADAAEMCAALYQQIPIKYGLKNYEKLRDAYLQRSALLRTIANRSPKKLPADISLGKEIKLEMPIPRRTTQKHPKDILKIAQSDARVKNRLNGHQGIREYAWFQGFAWTASFYNHGWGNLAIAIIDDKTGKVLDVLIDEHETDRQELSE